MDEEEEELEAWLDAWLNSQEEEADEREQPAAEVDRSTPRLGDPTQSGSCCPETGAADG
jgi:hypothetical protein